MHVLKQQLGLGSSADVVIQNMIWCFRWKEENYRFQNSTNGKGGQQTLLESNLLLAVSIRDKWSVQIKGQNFDSSPGLILATNNAETKAMKSPVLSWQRVSLLHTHLFQQTLIWGKGKVVHKWASWFSGRIYCPKTRAKLNWNRH